MFVWGESVRPRVKCESLFFCLFLQCCPWRVCVFQEESDQEKAVALEELERAVRQQHEQTELTYSDKMSQLTAQLQQLDSVVSQVQHPISRLVTHTATAHEQSAQCIINIYLTLKQWLFEILKYQY